MPTRWHPYRGADCWGVTRNRWYRFAQPPATIWKPSGFRNRAVCIKYIIALLLHFSLQPLHFLSQRFRLAEHFLNDDRAAELADITDREQWPSLGLDVRIVAGG